MQVSLYVGTTVSFYKDTRTNSARIGMFKVT